MQDVFGQTAVLPGWSPPARASARLRFSADFWDVLIRISAGALFASLAASYLLAAVESAGAVDPARPVSLIEWLSIDAIGMFYTTVALFIVVRQAPRAKANGLLPRLVAVLGSYVLGVYAFFPRNPELGPVLQAVSAVLILFGTASSIWVLTRLGRSFSVMAEARQLVTQGPYRVVRHPLYLAELVSSIGVFIAFASPWTAIVLAVQLGSQWRRMLNEEQVLSATFPDYAAYAARTRRLVPGVW